MKILMMVGSLRAGSWTRQLVDATVALLPAHVEASYAVIGDLPHYSQDLDSETPPQVVVDFRRAVEDSDALVVATPEYNGSLPGVLKNAIDWASRPRGSSALDGTPVAVLSVSPSPRGAQWAREDAEKVLRVAGAELLGRSVGVASIHDTVVDGRIADPAIEDALRGLTAELLAAGEDAAARAAA